MEQPSIEFLEAEVKKGREQAGSAIDEADMLRRHEITKKLWDMDGNTPLFHDLQFLLYLSHKQAESIQKLESKCDQLVLEIVKAHAGIKPVSFRMAWEPLDTIKFKNTFHDLEKLKFSVGFNSKEPK